MQFACLVSFLSSRTGHEFTTDEMRVLSELTEAQQNPVPPVDLKPLFDAMVSGQKIDAIRTYRTLTGFGLKESKDEVERVMELVEVARNAHNAEQKLATITRMADDKWMNSDLGAKVRQLVNPT